MSIHVHDARCMGKGKSRNVYRVTLACTTCKSALGVEHRVDFDYEPLEPGPDRAHRRAAEAHGTAVRVENVKILAAGGCLDAQRELVNR